MRYDATYRALLHRQVVHENALRVAKRLRSGFIELEELIRVRRRAAHDANLHFKFVTMKDHVEKATFWS